MKSTTCTFWVVAAIALSALTGCNGLRQEIDRATAQVEGVAEDLDAQTTDTGAYIRVAAKDIEEIDPWGTRIKVVYSQGGLAEQVVVRSAGPDKRFHTTDDVVATGFSANLKGIGEGVKRNVEATAAGAAKGLVKGTVSGVKESIKETFTLRRDKDHPDEPADAPPTAE